MKIPTLTLLNRAAESRGAEGQPSPAQTLDRLGLKSGESRLARLLASGNTAGPSTTGSARGGLLLEINGQQVPVRSEQALQAGSLVRVMRAGNELQLMEMVGNPGRSTLSQSLAHRIPSQHHLGEGLNQLLNRQPDGSIPEPARQSLQKLLQTLPKFGGGTPQGPGNTQAQTGNKPISLAPPEAISADRVKDWLSNSGLFREARLITAPSASSVPGGQPSEPAANDLKAQLIRLVGHLLPATSARGGGSGYPYSGLQAGLNALHPATTPELTGQDALRFPAPIAPSAVNTDRKSVV